MKRSMYRKAPEIAWIYSGAHEIVEERKSSDASTWSAVLGLLDIVGHRYTLYGVNPHLVGRVMATWGRAITPRGGRCMPTYLENKFLTLF